MPIYCARVHLIALSYSLIPTTNADSSLCECANRRPLRVCADLCPREMCANTHKSRLLGSVTGRESALSVCVRGRADVIAGFSDVHEENSHDDISRPTMFLRLGSALVRSARQNISASFLAYSKQHCCTSLLRCHRVSTFCTQTHWLCVCVWCVGDRGVEGRWLLKRFMLKRLWLDDGITTKVPAATHYSLVLQSMRILIIWKGRNTIVAKPGLMR